jgi:hypothetical protein
MNIRIRAARGLVLGTLLVAAAAQAQRAAQQTPRDAAPIDLTGYWVSVVTEDWRWRMMTPPPGDYARVPMTPAARAVADGWDLKADIANGDECRPYGAGGIMRVPTRLHISWEDDDTLRIDTDAGSQTRRFHFADFAPSSTPTWQGNSRAQWNFTGAVRGSAPTGGSLEVVTTEVLPGYVRWNGVPYSGDAVITEHFDVHPAFGQDWFTVMTVIEDPEYFTEPFIVSNHFRREPDGEKWNATSCVTDPPVRDAPADTGD